MGNFDELRRTRGARRPGDAHQRIPDLRDAAARDDAEAPSRRQALEMYTRNTAYAANDDDKRGTLEVGKYADLAVLSADYLSAPVKEVGKIRSLLTMVGGNVVYAAPPFAGMEAAAK